ncbi:MAG: hypothetical protein ACOC35_03160 [Promethearchaeia archaeon]
MKDQEKQEFIKNIGCASTLPIISSLIILFLAESFECFFYVWGSLVCLALI